MENFFDKKFRYTLLFIFLAEVLSFAGYTFPIVNKLAFIVIILLALFYSIKDLKYGIWLVLAELFIGSKGYLFFFTIGSVTLSIRIALWLTVLAVWAGKTLVSWIRNKKLQIDFFESSYLKYYLVLFAFILWGLINGFINHNSIGNLFFDFNGWLYFALVLPLYCVIKNRGAIDSILKIFFASLVWLCFESLALLFAFSHNSLIALYELYRWIRVTGVGEITLVQDGFYRIFFQSHIYVLAGIFIVIFFLKKLFEDWKQNKKTVYIYFSLLTILFSVVLISFSRSFWVGLACGFICLWIIIFINEISWRKFFALNGIILVSAILSVVLIIAIVKFPYPRPAGFDTASLFAQRLSQITGEAGVSSRWSLLPELAKKIQSNPIFGSGFGSTVTYKTSDPRVLETNPSGEYTTYAFEWGWLDIWLKLGLFGLFAYLLIIGKTIFDSVKINDFLPYGFALGLAVVAVVSMFSPYTNHPLGIGFLILYSLILDILKRESKTLA